MFLVFSFLVNRDYWGLFPQSWNGAWHPGFVKKSQNGFLGWRPQVKDHVVCDSVRSWQFLVFSASSSSFWMASVMHLSAGNFVFWELFLFRSDMPCSFSGEFHCALLLVHVGETVCGSLLCQVLILWINDCMSLPLVIFVKQLGAEHVAAGRWDLNAVQHAQHARVSVAKRPSSHL